MSFRIPDCHRLWSPFPELSATTLGPISGSYNPDPNTKLSALSYKPKIASAVFHFDGCELIANR
jgi:hypothetical protein